MAHPSDFARVTVQTVRDHLARAGVRVDEVTELKPGVVQAILPGSTDDERQDNQRRALEAFPLPG